MVLLDRFLHTRRPPKHNMLFLNYVYLIFVQPFRKWDKYLMIEIAEIIIQSLLKTNSKLQDKGNTPDVFCKGRLL